VGGTKLLRGGEALGGGGSPLEKKDFPFGGGAACRAEERSRGRAPERKKKEKKGRPSERNGTLDTRKGATILSLPRGER